METPRRQQHRVASHVWAELILTSFHQRWSFGSFAMEYGPESFGLRARQGTQTRHAVVERPDWWASDEPEHVRAIVLELVQQLSPEVAESYSRSANPYTTA